MPTLLLALNCKILRTLYQARPWPASYHGEEVSSGKDQEAKGPQAGKSSSAHGPSMEPMASVRVEAGAHMAVYLSVLVSHPVLQSERDLKADIQWF